MLIRSDDAILLLPSSFLPSLIDTHFPMSLVLPSRAGSKSLSNPAPLV